MEKINFGETQLVANFIKNAMVSSILKFYLSQQTNPDHFIVEISKLDPEEKNPTTLHIVDVTGLILPVLEDTYRKISHNVVTPWTVEKAKVISGLAGVLGDTRYELPIIVTYQEDEYTYNLSQDMVFGILVVLRFHQDFSLKVGAAYGDLIITFGDIAADYINDKKVIRKFVANIQSMEITFDTIQVIQGIITGASWVKESPHKYINDILDGGVLVSF